MGLTTRYLLATEQVFIVTTLNAMQGLGGDSVCVRSHMAGLATESVAMTTAPIHTNAQASH